jgi:hypothetical protein
MSQELRILREQGHLLNLTVTGWRARDPQTWMCLTATLGPDVLSNLPLPKGSATKEGEAAPEPKPKEDPKKPRKLRYTPRSSLSELIRQALKEMQEELDKKRKGPGTREGETELKPCRGKATVPGAKQKQSGTKGQPLAMERIEVNEQDWEYEWTVTYNCPTANQPCPMCGRAKKGDKQPTPS